MCRAVQCSVKCAVQCAVQCAVYSVQCVQCAVCSVCSVQCAVHSVQYALRTQNNEDDITETHANHANLERARKLSDAWGMAYLGEL